MGGGFQSPRGLDGTIYAYPGRNASAPPSAKMPANGLYFDNIIRQEDLEGHDFDARRDYGDQYSVFTEEDCRHYERVAKELYEGTDCAVFGDFFLGGVAPQKTLPFGTPEEVVEETSRNVRILSEGGGYACAAVHNIQAPTPVENILAFFQGINDS